MRIPSSPVTTRPAARTETPAAPKAPAAARKNAVATRAADLFAPAKVATTAAPVNTDGLKTFAELSANQQHLLGVDGAQTYAKLSSDDRAVFLFLTARMDHCGADYSGLTLKNPLETIRRNRLLFNDDPAGVAKFKASLEAGKAKGGFIEDKPFGGFHKGYSDWGVRENVRKWTTQYGIGSEGAFVDVDRYNYKADWKAYLGHTSEILDPRHPDPLKIAKELGVDLSSHLPAQVA